MPTTDYVYKFYKPEIKKLSKSHFSFKQACYCFYTLFPMLMKVLCSFKDMVNNVFLSFMYVYIYICICIHIYSKSSKNSSPVKSSFKLQRTPYISCMQLCCIKRVLYIYGGRLLGTLTRWGINFCTAWAFTCIFNVLQFGNYVHMKLIKVTSCYNL